MGAAGWWSRRKSDQGSIMSDHASPTPHIPGRHLFPSDLPYHSTRNPVRPSGRGFRGKFASRKMRRMVRCESLLEMNCLYLAEFARTIAAFDEQPVSISYLISGRRRRYTPDFRFLWQDGREWFVEVKPAEKLNTPENNERFAAITSHFESAGARFVALTEEQICQSHRSKMVQYLLRMRPKDSGSSAWADLSWDDHRSASFAEAAQLLGSPKTVVEALARRELACDLHQPLTAGTSIRTFAEADDDALFV